MPVMAPGAPRELACVANDQATAAALGQGLPRSHLEIEFEHERSIIDLSKNVDRNIEIVGGGEPLALKAMAGSSMKKRLVSSHRVKLPVHGAVADEGDR